MNAKQKVLVVDDEQRNQRIVEETILDYFDTKYASSGEAALEALNTFEPDLILLDIMMPGIDGYEVCKKVRNTPKFSQTKIVLISGKAMVEERIKGYESGADDYMTKPFEPAELLAKVKVYTRLAFTEKQLIDLNHSLDNKVQEKTRQLLETKALLVNTAKMSALGEMAGGIAHEINTPLATISMVMEQVKLLLTRDPINKPELLTIAEMAHQTVHRIKKIIDGLRTFCRDSSKDPFLPAPVLDLFQSTIPLCQEKLMKLGIGVTIENPETGLTLLCRPVQISQVLLNLIGNSADAIGPIKDKWIKLSAKKAGGSVQIRIMDSGKGIPKDVREKLFQPFFTTKEVGKGTGLGLSISKGIVEAHHGTLNLDETSENTCFVLTLPSGK